MNTLNTPDLYGKRPYQQKAIKNIVHHTTELVQDRLMVDAANEDMSQKYPTAALLEMATGSGKTYTNGKILEKIINIRERYNRRYNTTHFQ
jgi:type I site-specific restriction endonuclease